MPITNVPTIFSPVVAAEIPVSSANGNGFTLSEPGVYVLVNPGFGWYYSVTNGLPVGSMTFVAPAQELTFTINPGDAPLTRFVKNVPPHPGSLVQVTYTPPVPGTSSNLSFLDLGSVSGAVAINAEAAELQVMVLTGAVTIGAPTNPSKGRKLALRFTQDGTGNFAVTLDTIFHFSTDLPAFVAATAAGAISYLVAWYNEDSNRWDVVGKNVGF